MKRTRIVLSIIAVSFSAALFFGGDTNVKAETTLEKAKRNGFIQVGFPNQVPYAYATAKGKLTGADTELARMVFNSMGIKEMVGVLTEFASLIPGLKAAIAHFSGDPAWGVVRPPLVELQPDERAGLIQRLEALDFSMPGLPGSA